MKFYFIFMIFLWFFVFSVLNAKRADRDQMPRYTASDKGLHCLQMSLSKERQAPITHLRPFSDMYDTSNRICVALVSLHQPVKLWFIYPAEKRHVTTCTIKIVNIGTHWIIAVIILKFEQGDFGIKLCGQKM